MFSCAEENVDETRNSATTEAPVNSGKKKIELCNSKRKAIFARLLEKSVDGKLKNRATQVVASQFSVSRRTVQRIWKQGKNQSINADVSHKKIGNCGRKKIQVDLTRIRDIPLNQRTTIKSLACALNMSTTTLFRNVKSGSIRKHSNAIKPSLKEENKRARLKFCISMLDKNSIPHDPLFLGMHNIIHIDEKWFYLTKKCEKYYLLKDEEDPIRSCKSKNFIAKVMFLVLVQGLMH